MKLFQIEEPEGGPTDPAAPGAAVGVDLSGAAAAVAMAVGGNAVHLEDRPGFELNLAVPPAAAPRHDWQDLLEGVRVRAERALARPVTHAVIAVGAGCDEPARVGLQQAAEAAGLVVLRIVSAQAQPGTAPALAAAILAEELAPRSTPGAC